MAEFSDKPRLEGIDDRISVALLLSKEFRWLYFLVQGFLLLLSVFLFAMGGYNLRAWILRYNFPTVERVSLESAVLYLCGGMLALILSVVVRQARQYFHRVRELTVADIRSVELSKIKEDDFEGLDRIQQVREEKAQRDFERNLRSTLIVERLEASHMVLFRRADWNLQPGVNVLLGRNGYGKSLLLRTLAGVLQQDEEVLRPLLRGGSSSLESSIDVRLKRNGVEAHIRRNTQRFVESFGKVPLLAIPDSRFLDRSQEAIGLDDNETSDLRTHGAHHFLHQKPYGSVVRGLIYEICLDYWEHGRNFDLPVFKFLQECVTRLTDSDFRFHSIKRKGRTGFEVRVLSEGNVEAVPIQSASQGTLSVLAMFGLIRSYVKATSAKTEGGVVQKGSAIVLIDEADAHLHPAWQQRFSNLLKDLFPSVQFILSAHSPLFVAGCWRGEVAVLRRYDPKSHQNGFTVEQLDQDFVGATAAELYKKVFDIEELDGTYLEYATKATLRTDNSTRINELSDLREKGSLSEKQEQELRNLEEESRRIGRAVEVQEQRLEESKKDLRIEELQSQILQLETRGPRESGDAKL
jgi:ABC-type multidrug transport system ATPase subunit